MKSAMMGEILGSGPSGGVIIIFKLVAQRGGGVGVRGHGQLGRHFH